tara:strand:+ start:1137 stop:1337 length:201 start_codon:yes stop_codon:yes gene_type:complete
MDENKIIALSTTMLAFTGFLVGLFTLVYYIYQIRQIANILIAITLVNIYILINVSFLTRIKEVLTK